MREKVFLTCNENALKNDISAGRTKAEKDKRIKMKRVEERKEKYSAKGKKIQSFHFLKQNGKNTTKLHDNEVLC